MLQIERNRLIEDNMGLVGKVIKDRVRGISSIGIFDYDDLFQIGCIGLCKAADSHRSGRGCFSTYAYIIIRNEIFDALNYATLRRTHESATDPLEIPDNTIPGSATELLFDLDRALDAAQSGASGVTAKGIAAIRLLAEGYTHRDIGERMGASANNVSAWVARARKYLRSRPDIAALGEMI
jgi:RNA polymerase sigma factor (sigma-70 family)